MLNSDVADYVRDLPTSCLPSRTTKNLEGNGEDDQRIVALPHTFLWPVVIMKHI